MLWSACVCLCVCLVAGQTELGAPPNIVVIMADDLGWNDVGFHGSNEIPTPNIDALAYNGVSLERYYASPTCTPSRTAFYTGKYPIHLGMQGPPIGAGQPRGIPLTEVLLPQHLRTLGYATHLVGKWHVGSYTSQHTPTYRGFDSFFGYLLGYLGNYDGLHISNAGFGVGMDAHRNTDDAWQEFVGKYITDLFTEEAVKVIKAHNTSRPLYLQVMHAAPHSGVGEHRLEVRDKQDTLHKYRHIAEFNRRLFAGMVEALDDSVGQIVSSLKAKGLLENSIVVFLSDNGAPTVEPMWNTNNYGSNWPLRGIKCSLHDGGIRVPAVVYSPLLSNPNTSTEFFHVTDWLPTLYHAAGGDTAELGAIDGVSQWDALKSYEKNTERKYAVLDLDETLKQQALIHEHWKIIKYDANSFANFSNYFYGSSGRDASEPEYNLTSVTSSPAHAAIVGDREPDLAYYRHKRSYVSVDSKCRAVTANQTHNVSLCNDYCLFNIYADPCETDDLSKTHPELLKTLITVLESYNKTRVLRSNFTTDPRSHPKYWNNRWVSWMDPENASREPSGSVSVMFSDNTRFVLVLVVTVVVSKLCGLH